MIHNAILFDLLENYTFDIISFKDYNSKNQEVYVMIVSVMNEELFIVVQGTWKEFSISIHYLRSFL